MRVCSPDHMTGTRSNPLSVCPYSSVPGYFDTAGSKSITGQLQRVISVNWDVRADTKKPNPVNTLP